MLSARGSCNVRFILTGMVVSISFSSGGTLLIGRVVFFARENLGDWLRFLRVLQVCCDIRNLDNMAVHVVNGILDVR